MQWAGPFNSTFILGSHPALGKEGPGGRQSVGEYWDIGSAAAQKLKKWGEGSLGSSAKTCQDLGFRSLGSVS